MRNYGEHAKRILALNSQVTVAIIHAEHLDPDSPETNKAFAEVSRIEEELASLLPTDCVEGALARLGAVTAAMDADDWPRASMLIGRFRVGAAANLANELERLEEEVCAQRKPSSAC